MGTHHIYDYSRTPRKADWSSLDGRAKHRYLITGVGFACARVGMVSSSPLLKHYEGEV